MGNMLRAAYGAVQIVCLCLVAYTYIQATFIPDGSKNKVIYVPPPPTPFADPNAPNKKFTEKKFGDHVLTTARSLLTSTLFGIAMTVGLHMYKKMVMGIA